MTKKQLRLTSIIIVVVLVFSYLMYQIVTVSKADIKTEVAIKDTVYNTINTKCFIVRDENYIENAKSGTAVSFIHNGGRVAAGDTVSIIFDDEKAASVYLRKSELQKEIDHYNELNGQANLHAVNMDSLDEKISKELASYLEAVDTLDFSSAIQKAEDFRNSVTSKQISTGSTLDYSKKLTELQKEFKKLNNKNYSYNEIRSKESGYYIEGADGYEDTVPFDKIDDITADDIKTAIKSSPEKISKDVKGRTVSSFDWYICCVVKSEQMVNLKSDQPLYVNFPFAGVEKLPVDIYKIGEKSDKETLLILKCSLMNEILADLRIEDIEIVTDEYNGLKIKSSAVRTVDGQTGVYVQCGNLINFRKIHIVYSGKDYSIVDNPDAESGYIRLYDSVVVKGVEMYDNKLVP